MKKIRLSEQEITLIKEAFTKLFPASDKLWIFGSRVKSKSKGGDIDLYIESKITEPEQINRIKFDFYDELILSLGDQKIDIIIKFGSHELPIYDVAKNEGVRLV